MSLTHTLKKPIITEKSLSLTKNGVFTFEVDRLATKGQIKQAVKDYFGVDAVSITTITQPEKSYRTGKRRLLKKAAGGKKAQIKLKSGQKIDLFEIEQS